MGAVDNGTQTILWDYKQAIDSSEINKTFYKILSPGVYDGGTLTISSGNDILIAPLQVMVETSTNQLVKISTTSNATLTLAEITPYVTCQFSWADSETNYMDFTAKAFGDITTNDIVLGMGVYVGGVLTSFDYSYKTWGDKPYILDSSITLNVGTGGQFTTINDAIEYAWSNYYPAYVKGGIQVTINLLSGFIMSEQLLVTGLDMSWIRITGEDADTTIRRSALTSAIRSTYPAFGADQGKLPIISQAFTMDTSGTANGLHHGIWINSGSYCRINAAGAGVKNADGFGFYCSNSSAHFATGAVFTGCVNTNVYIVNESNVIMTGINASNGNSHGILVYNSTVSTYQAVATGCVNYGLNVDQASTVFADGSQFSSTGSGYGVSVKKASSVSITGATISSSANHGLYVISSMVDANGATISSTSTSASHRGVHTSDSSVVNLTSATISASTGSGVYANNGSTIGAYGSNSTGGSGYYGYQVSAGGVIRAGTGTIYPSAPNAISSSGIIFQ